MAEHGPSVWIDLDEEITDEEVCPRCGDFVGFLLTRTGWCKPCSNKFAPLPPTPNGNGQQREGRLCDRCEDSYTDGNHKYCRNCRAARWLESHADEIEHYMGANGLSKFDAMVKAKMNDELQCSNCGSKMKPPTNGERLFCSKKNCRRAYNRFKILVHVKGYDRETALNRILTVERSKYR